jgi:hydrogenase large subunit
MATVYLPGVSAQTEAIAATTTIKIDPATRLEGHLEVTLEAASGKVTSAKSGGMMYRGFENMLKGKDPRDAVHITQRVCGVCPTPQAMAASLAGEAAAGMRAPTNARLVRNLILGADFLHSHILHFYHLALPSFIKGPNMPPWTPAYSVDLRFSAADTNTLVTHYVQALAARRQAHEMGAILGGKLPHTVAYEFGGVTSTPDSSMVTRFRNYLNQLVSFIDGVYMPDVDKLATVYPDYYNIGRGYGNLLSFGVFDLDDAAQPAKLLARGRVANGATSVQSLDLNAIAEQAKYSWYNDTSAGLNPLKGVTSPNPDKAGAYSWLKAPRYAGEPYEAGPLARMWVTGAYRRGISVMDRHQARAHETSRIAHAMLTWLSQLNLSGSFYTRYNVPTTGTGIGLTEAPRGVLGHWLQVSGGTISSYQIVTPTCWNCSPRDNAGKAGPMEKALEGTPVTNAAEPTEPLRVVHSFDPCLSCSVH